MADPRKAVSENVDGAFFVDSTCINCDTCRQLAPDTFRDAGEYSSVYAQPLGGAQEGAAFHALLSCPTGSIGTRGKNEAKRYMSDFPMPIEGNVYYCGFNSEKSYGANSFFIRHPEGNWLIDSPKYLPTLSNKIRELGGIKYILLTHRDDVAEAGKYAQAFQAQRIIHKADASAEPDSEIILEGQDTIDFQPGFQIIPVPGHTRGHVVLLYAGKYLFSGDHLHVDADSGKLEAFPNHCWYSWTEQAKSMAKLAGYSFEWILAGHGNRAKLAPTAVKRQMRDLVARMQHSSK